MEYDRAVVRDRDTDRLTYKDVNLKSPVAQAALDNQKRAILASITNCLQVRFENTLQEEAFTACNVFDPKNWPDNDELAMYGQEEVAAIFEHFDLILTACGTDLQSALREWEELKVLISQRLHAVYAGVHPLAIWQRVARDDRGRHE